MYHPSNFLYLLLLPIIGFGQSTALPKVSIADTEVREIASHHVQSMDYEIHIALPRQYVSSDQNYPVVYYLDAYYWGATIIETYRLLRAFNEIPPLILVGISYKDATRAEATFNRSRDFIPTEITSKNMGKWANSPPAASGGAEQFLQFIKEELMPLINQNYRTNPNDTGILGYSYGGLFATYVLFRDPSTFSKYLIGSPYLAHDEFQTIRAEKEYFASNKSLNAKVFLSIGMDEWEPHMLSWMYLKNLLQGRNYEGLKLIVKSFEGENHTSNIPGTMSRALRELYKRE